ncbi:metallophosphoesterase family protein [Marinobacterium sediminicola]|uniref:3',5'-cyclic AMP phosphodiesterase CpdA n=1 Tax=Marinobacterium sediminicola TaxID=518898 RepID=A0ABY1S1Q1_9GAMM|nr:metallophosphoesterase [Marinobacterium sediminicola]ULG69762.1 metallophosphoesterase [Marinobacterium sediminicola]SMR75428.1 3',5'-cyclic AMP phosphodiesterase CpdA [Marinobacterium sediminicola]
MRMIQLSDLHFGTERPEVMDALVTVMHQLSPDLLLLSGDITQRARRAQFRACERLLARLPPAAIMAVPGNHDIPLFNLWQRLVAPYAHFTRTFGDDLLPCHDSGQVLVVGVNTTCPRRHIDGTFTEKQIETVAHRLKASHARVKIVMGHHPVDAVLESDERNIARGAERAVRTWTQAGMQLYLAGHIHYPFCARLERRYPGLSPECWTFQAGTAISFRVRDHKANSFNLIEWLPAQQALQLERWDYTPAIEGFLCAEQIQLPLRGGAGSSGSG